MQNNYLVTGAPIQVALQGPGEMPKVVEGHPEVHRIAMAIFATLQGKPYQFIECNIEALDQAYQKTVSLCIAIYEKVVASHELSEADLLRMQRANSSLHFLEKALAAVDLADSKHARLLKMVEHASYCQNMTQGVMDLAASTSYLREADDDLIDRTYGNEDPLLALDALRNLESLSDTLLRIQPSDNEQERSLYQDFLQNDLDSLAATTIDWAAKIKTKIKDELAALVDEHGTLISGDAERMLYSLEKQLERLQEGIEALGQLPDQPEFKESLRMLRKGLKNALTTVQNERTRFKKEFPEVFSRVITNAPVYEDEEWKRLHEARPKLPSGFFARNFKNLLHPSEWKDSTKRVAYFVFNAMQLSQQAIGAVQTVNQALHFERTGVRQTTKEAAHDYKTEPVPSQTTSVAGVVSNVFGYLGGIARTLADPVSAVQSTYRNLVESLDALRGVQETVGVEDDLREALRDVPWQTGLVSEVVDWEMSAEEACEQANNLTDAHRLKAFLASPPIPIDDGVLLHVLGDRFGGGTTLEGGTSQQMLEYRLAGVEAKIKVLKHSEKAEGLEELLHLRDQLVKARDLLNAYNGDFSRFQSLWSKRIQDLAEGETFFMPFSWPGHAVALEGRKQANGLYTLRVYNTGDGINQYHANAAVDTKQLYVPYADMMDITEQQMTDPLLLRAMQQMRNHVAEPAMHSTDLYQTIFHQTKGSYVIGELKLSDFKDPQRSGTCSYFSLVPVFRELLAQESVASHFEFETQFKALMDYVDGHKARFSKEELPRRLVRKAMEIFAFETREAHRQGAISDHELRFASITVKRISDDLDVIDRQVAQQIATNAIHLQTIPQPLNQFGAVVAPTFTDYGVAKDYPTPADYVKIPTNTWKPAPNTIADDLQRFSQDLAIASERGQYLNTLESLKEIGLRLPLPETAFWETLTATQVEPIVKQLVDLSLIQQHAMLMAAAHIDSWQHRLEPDAYLAQIKMLALADSFLRRFPELFGGNPPSLYQKSFKSFLYNEAGLLQLRDPRWERELGTLQDYWRETMSTVATTPNFFAFELAPAGMVGFHFQPPIRYDIPLDDVAKERLKREGGYHGDIDQVWPEIEWAKDWVKRPEVKTRILEQHPEWKDISDLDLAIAAISEDNELAPALENGILPPLYFEIRKLAFASDYLITGSFSKRLGEQLPTDPLQACFSVNYVARPLMSRNAYRDPSNKASGWSVYQTMFRYRPEVEYPLYIEHSAYGDPQRLIVEYGKSNYASKSWLHLRNEVSLPNEPWLRHILFTKEQPKGFYKHGRLQHTWLRNRININQAMVEFDPDELSSHPTQIDYNDGLNGGCAPFYEGRYDKSEYPKEKQRSKLTLQDVRKLTALSNSKELQVQESLAYFKEHSVLLRDRPYQVFFNMLLFEPGLVADELAKAPRDALYFVNDISQFIKTSYALYVKLSDTPTALYFLYLNDRMNRLVSFYKEQGQFKVSASYQPPFLDSRQELLALLQKAKGDERTVSAIYQSLALSYELDEKLTTKAVTTILIASIYKSLYGIANHLDDREATFALEELPRHHRNEIEAALASPERNTILNAVYHAIRPDQRNPKWGPDVPFPHVKGEGQSAQVYLNVLDGTFVDGSSLQRLPDVVFKNSLLKTVFDDPEPPFSSQPSPDIYVFGSKKGESFQVKKVGEQLTIQKNIGNKWYQLTNPDFLPSQMHVQALKADFQHWYSALPQPEVLVSDPKSGKLLYRIELSESRVKAVHRLDEAGLDTELILVNLESAPELQGLSRLEDPSHVMVWRDKGTGELKLIEMPRLQLTFEPKSEKSVVRFYSTTFKGFRIAETQHVDSLGDVDAYLLLEKKSGEKMVVFSRQQILEGKAGSLVTDLKPDRSIVERGPDSPGYVTYLVDRVDGSLQPVTDEARLYLAMVYLWEQKYDLARDLLRGYGTQLRPYTDQERKVLDWIAKLDNRNHDADLRAVALRLQAWSMLARNLQHYPKARELGERGAELKAYLMSEKDRETLGKAYVDYLQHIDQVNSDWLRPDEESLLLPQMDLSIPMIRNRETMLKQRELNVRQTSIFPGISGQRPSFKNRVFIGGEQFASAIGGSSRPSTILRGGLIDNFYDYYEMARGEKDIRVQQLAALSQHSMSLDEDLKTRYSQILQYMQGNSRKEEAAAAWLLEMVLINPGSFPQTWELRSTINTLRDSINQDARVEAQKWLDNNLIQPQQDMLWNLYPEWKFHQQTAELELPTVTPQVIDPAFSICVRLLDNADLQSPLELARGMLEEHPPQSADRERLSNSTQQLRQVFSFSGKDAFVNGIFSDLRQKLATFAQSESALGKQYRIRDFQAFTQLQTEISQAIPTLTQQLAGEESSILALANKLSSVPTERAQASLKLQSTVEMPMEIDEVLRLFAFRDAERFHARNPALSAEDIVKLNDRIQAYLEKATLVQHLQRVSNSAKAIVTGNESGAEPQEINRLLEAFAIASTSRREYLVSDHPEYLVFEYYMEILLRGDQKANLDKLRIKDGRIGDQKELGAVLEMIMGSGKTAVLLPLLGQMIADGERLAVVVMPEALLPFMSRELQERVGESFGQGVEVMTFTRGGRLGEVELRHTLDRLQLIVRDRRVLMLTNSSVQSLYLNFLVRFFEYQNLAVDSPNRIGLETELMLMREIFAFLKERGDVVIDEVDFVLDVLKSHHFAIGDRTPLSQEVVEPVTELYRLLGNEPITPETYKNRVKGQLIEAMLDGKMLSKNDGMQAFIKSLNIEERGLLSRYLHNESAADVKAFILSIGSKSIRNTLSVLQEELNQLLTLTTKKKLDVHYGPLPEKLTPQQAQQFADTGYLAVPYHSGEPAVGSQFGTELEILNYTIQMHLERGIPRSVLELELRRLQQWILQEVATTKRPVADDWEAMKAFSEIAGPNAKFGLFSYTDADLETMLKNVHGNRDLQLRLIGRYVIPQIRTYAKQLNSDAQIYGMLFKALQGFSGTLWNVQTFPRIFGEVHLSDTAERTLHLLWNSSPQAVDLLPATKSQAGNVKGLVASLYEREAPKGSVIDTAGLFRGISNEAVAREILALECWKNTEIEGVVFYDVQDEMMVLERGNPPKSVPMGQTLLKPHQLIAFWDQKHTTGSDIRLGIKMTAAVTVGKQTSMRDLLQAVWRLRQLHKGQKVNFVVAEEDHKVIAEVLTKLRGKAPARALQLEDILLYVQYNQAQQQGDHNHRSLIHKMQTVLSSKILEVLTDPKVSISASSEVYTQTRGLFETDRAHNPSDQYGKLRTEMERKAVVEEELQTLLASEAVRAFQTHPLLNKRFPFDSIMKELRGIIAKELEFLPSMLEVSDNFEQEVAIEAEQERQQQKETQKEVEQESQATAAGWDTYASALPNIEWQREGLYTNNYFLPAKFSDLARKEYAKTSDLRPLMQVTDLLAGSAFRSSEVFDPNIFITLNLAPVQETGVKRAVDYQPFNQFQKESTQLLIIQDKVSGQLSGIMLDPNDAARFNDLLQQPLILGESREVRLGLYHLTNGLYRQGAESIDEKALEKDPDFQRVVIQAKFFNGEVYYSLDEVPILKDWLKNDPDGLGRLFRDQILKWRETSARFFGDSVLDRIFKELGSVDSTWKRPRYKSKYD